VELIVEEGIVEAVLSRLSPKTVPAVPARLALREPWGTTITLRSS
jgi:hypothetical protein